MAFGCSVLGLLVRESHLAPPTGRKPFLHGGRWPKGLTGDAVGRERIPATVGARRDSRTSVLNQADPLRCPKCGGTMKNIAFVEADQGDIIRKILEHCGLWEDPPAARLVDARRPGRRQVRNRPPRLPGICPPRRGLRRRFQGVFPQVSRPNCPGRRESGSEIAHFVLEPVRDPIILCAGQPRRGSPEPGKSAKEAKRILQAPNKAGPEDHAGVKRPWCPNPSPP